MGRFIIAAIVFASRAATAATQVCVIQDANVTAFHEGKGVLVKSAKISKTGDDVDFILGVNGEKVPYARMSESSRGRVRAAIKKICNIDVKQSKTAKKIERLKQTYGIPAHDQGGEPVK